MERNQDFNLFKYSHSSKLLKVVTKYFILLLQKEEKNRKKQKNTKQR